MGGISGMDHGSSATSTAPSAPASTGSAADVMFAQMMVPHHRQAIEMADLALKKGSASAQVKALAGQIRRAQDPEIATLNGWLTAWGAPASDGAMDHGVDGMMTEQDMASLAGTDGAAFDRMWLTMMVEHHEGAVAMSKDALARTQNLEVRRLTQAIITGQQKEIATMKGLLS